MKSKTDFGHIYSFVDANWSSFAVGALPNGEFMNTTTIHISSSQRCTFDMKVLMDFPHEIYSQSKSFIRFIRDLRSQKYGDFASIEIR